MRGIKTVFSLLVVLLVTLPAYAQFTQIGLKDRHIQEIRLHEDYLYAATDRGIYKLDVQTGGASWELIGMENRSVSSFVILSGDTLLAGSKEATEQDSVFLYATFDGGATWQPYQNGFGSDSTYRSIVDVDRAGPGNDTLFAASRGDIYRSPDRGQSWTNVFISARYEGMATRTQTSYLHGPVAFRFIKADFQENPLVYAGGQNDLGTGELLSSSDAGANWESSLIYDHETPWEQVDSILVNDVLVKSFQPTDYLAAGSSYILKMDTDSYGGGGWRTEFYQSRYSFEDLAVYDGWSEVIYAGGENHGKGLKLFKTENGGDNWSVFDDSTADANDVRSLAIHEELNGGIVFLGTEDGVYYLHPDAKATPADIRPTVEITSPSDSSTRYYAEVSNSYYNGIELEVNGVDKDGHITKYGWAIGEDSLKWTSDTTIVIDETEFGSPGRYTLRVTALDDDSLRATPDTIQIHLVGPSLDQGLLVIDGTTEKHILRDPDIDYFTDNYADSLYKSWIHPLQFNQWDVQEKGLPTREEIGRYATVFWHADNWYGPSEHAHKIGEHTSVLGDYMSVGGDVIISGWKILKSIYPALLFPSEFEPSVFVNRYLKIKSVSSTGTTPPGEFIGAYGKNEYPDVVVDSSRIKGYPASFFDHMVDVMMIQDSSEESRPIFTFRCRENCEEDRYPGSVVAHHHSNEVFHSAIIGFPLTFLKEKDAAATLHRLMDDFGYEVTSSPQPDKPEEFSLEDNYPNPFNPETKIKFSLPQTSKVSLVVYNIIGQKVATILNTRLRAGNHSVTFDGSGLTSGVYIYRLKAEGFSQSRKMLLVK